MRPSLSPPLLQRRIGAAYGVEFIAVDIVDILPPDDLADGLNAVIQADAESAAAFFRSQGECQQRVRWVTAVKRSINRSKRGAQRRDAHAEAVEKMIRDLRYGAVVQAVRIVWENGVARLEAATDPRKGGRPAGR